MGGTAMILRRLLGFFLVLATPKFFFQPQTIIGLATPGVLTLALATPSVLLSGSWPRSCHSEKSGMVSETCMATPFWLTISLMICKD